MNRWDWIYEGYWRGYGRISGKKMCTAISSVVKDKIVMDIGCGHGAQSAALVKLGAKQVIAVDEEDEFVHRDNKSIYFMHDRLEDVETKVDVALVSWPINTEIPGLLLRLEQTPVVIYVGHNSIETGISCGTLPFFMHMTHRKLLASGYNKKNSMSIVGERLLRPRRPTAEEARGMRKWKD